MMTCFTYQVIGGVVKAKSTRYGVNSHNPLQYMVSIGLADWLVGRLTGLAGSRMKTWSQF